MTPARPSLRVERALQREGHRLLCGMDEVGRGALAGPVSVGAVVIDEHSPTAPQGVRDSKLLTPAARERLVPRLRRWAVAYAVGHASAAEIDRIGIMAALRLAGRRALAMLEVEPDLVILDGNYDWLSDREVSPVLLSVEQVAGFGPDVAVAGQLRAPGLDRPIPPVTTMIKADMKCSSVAAASVLAKVERDAMLRDFHEAYPQFNWAGNKGYSAPDHLAAIEKHGPCELHRRSWRPFGGVGDCADGAIVGAPADAADTFEQSASDAMKEWA
ncbi:ribonuclease HII [Allobranchiibius sp. CTAmp26]|uniref:ribonuclease HII n=1 Tax=Allobranchiibius sp. CTAmp26 TaxID=2815214 RepID=UPI001AA0F809|nr:ribonuclease HII [Allobranchiibius sp. CTAmp26]MBO1756114.1 ribonuclease HII [Allobranchiibius sp. CTAmp26]